MVDRSDFQIPLWSNPPFNEVPTGRPRIAWGGSAAFQALEAQVQHRKDSEAPTERHKSFPSAQLSPKVNLIKDSQSYFIPCSLWVRVRSISRRSGDPWSTTVISSGT